MRVIAQHGSQPADPLPTGFGGVRPDRDRVGTDGYPPRVPTLRLFAAAREAAGTGSATVGGSTVGEVLDHACEQYGPGFAAVLATAKIWCNGDPVERDHEVSDADEVAVLPPVSGGSW